MELQILIKMSALSALFVVIGFLIRFVLKNRQQRQYNQIVKENYFKKVAEERQKKEKSSYQQALKTKQTYEKSLAQTKARQNADRSQYQQGLNTKQTYEKNLAQTKKKSDYQQNHWNNEFLQSLEWKIFEELCAELFNKIGYQAKLSGKGADKGIDIYLSKHNKKFAIVQCKAWKSKKVGVKEVRELFGVMVAESYQQCIFITSGSYTNNAIEFAQKQTITLISGTELLRLITKLSKYKQQVIFDKITQGDYTTPSCPSCDIKMMERVAKQGAHIGRKFWGCPSYPKCRHTFFMQNNVYKMDVL